MANERRLMFTAEFQKLPRPSLFWQIVSLCGAMILLTILGTWLAADSLANQYKAVLSARYGVGMEVAHDMFVDSLHRALLLAGGVGALASLVAGAVFVPRILQPFREMARKADRVAQGDFSVRVELDRVAQRCEVHALGSAFNRMAGQLQRMDGARKRMIADLSHDLLSPLANLRGYIEGLRDGVVTATPDVFAMLEGEIGRLIRLVGDLHQLTIAEGARGALQPQMLNVAKLFADSTGFIAHEAAAKAVSIETDVAAEAEMLVADHDALVRVLGNMLHNAVRHAQSPSIVRLTARSAGHWIVLACANRGAPIAEADLPFIFDRFYRADPARSREGGAGLGLAIVKELIEAHDGVVSARSSPEETVISLRLPNKTVTSP